MAADQQHRAHDFAGRIHPDESHRAVQRAVFGGGAAGVDFGRGGAVLEAAVAVDAVARAGEVPQKNDDYVGQNSDFLRAGGDCRGAAGRLSEQIVL